MSSSSSSSSFPSVKSCILLLGLLLCSSNTIRTAKAETDTEKASPSKLGSAASIEDLEYDENKKLAKHYLVFPANRPDCPTSSFENGTKELFYGFAASPLEGDALAMVFPNDFEEDDDEEEVNHCMAACLEKGTDIKVAGHTMPHYHFESRGQNDAKDTASFETWFQMNCQRVEVCLINYVVRERPLKIHWIDKNGESQYQFDLKYSERNTNCFFSYLGHQFEAIDEESGFYEKVTIEHLTTMAFGTSPPSSSQTFDEIEQLEKKVKVTLDHEWSRHLMVERTFSSLGFAKGRLADDLFANMGAFYYNNRNSAVNEEWEGKGVFVNWWETDVKFVSIPWTAKHKWQLRLSEMVSEWAGVEVEETSMYGLRQYEEGARLLSHVDRIPTHAVSLIVNIGQDNLANPWPVEVFDHADRLHEVTMEPGDIVYYESAKNLHSRNRPLTCKQGGCRYINLFTHYRPKGDGDSWHRKFADKPNRPPPLLDGQVDYDSETSSCRLPKQQKEQVDNATDNILGVGTVECNDNRLGPHVSPTLFKLKSARDLYRWWKATEDPNFIGFDDADSTGDSYDTYVDDEEDSVMDDDGYEDEGDDDDDDGPLDDDDDDDDDDAGYTNDIGGNGEL